jgi:hypothetical protein
MAYNKLNAKQIRPGILDDSHLKAGAAISESKLNIDWATRGNEILGTKLLVDFVQVNGKSINSGVNNVAVTSSITAPVADADTVKGAVVQSGKNRVVIREAVTGDPVSSADGTEVYGKLTHNGTDYILSFFYKDAGNVEQAYTFASAATVDFQFPQRFDLSSITETFASNEKFVDGASDVSARLDLEQIVKDAFGGAYALGHDGTAVRPQSIVAELLERTVGAINTTVSASDIIDELVDARGGEVDLDTRLGGMETATGTNTSAISTINTELVAGRGTFGDLNARFDDVEGNLAQELIDRADADQTIIDDLASVLNGKGASLIGVEDFGGVFVATTVEGVLSELEGRLQDVESLTSSTEVADARDSVLTGAHASLDERLEAGETLFDAVKTEVEAARGTFGTVKLRLDDVDTKVADHETRVGNNETAITDHSTRIDTLESNAHVPYAEDHEVLAGDPLINGSRYDLMSGTYVTGDKSLNVYMNGMLQMNGVHYTEIASGTPGEGIAISFAPELIVEGDIIQLRWTK